MNERKSAPAPDLRGHVVQISPDATEVSAKHRGCLGHIVSVHPWGATVGVRMPLGVAYVRVTEDNYRPIGAPAWCPGWCVE